MGASGSWRTEPLPPDWETYWRPRILGRDPFCMWPSGCTRPSAEVDHIIRGAGESDENLQGLCSPHHKIKSSGEGGQVTGAMRHDMARRKYRNVPEHPGFRKPPPAG